MALQSFQQSSGWESLSLATASISN